jgi:lipid-binding SYLF domain-containing protein
MLFLLPFVLLAQTSPSADTTRRLEESGNVFSEIMDVADKAIPQKLLDKGECLVIVPGLKKGAFIFGGKYGRGFATCRHKSGAGWSAPAAVRVEGGSFGFQIGGSETDVVMLVLNQRGVERLMRSKFTIGGDAAVAAGPVGRNITAETDAMLSAEILTWSRSRGVFAGVALQGATLRPDKDVNRELYGQPWGTKEVVTSGLTPPTAAQAFMKLLNRYSSRKSS